MSVSITEIEPTKLQSLVLCFFTFSLQPWTLFGKNCKGDEKWVMNRNVKRRETMCCVAQPPLSASKGRLHPKYILLSVWWDVKRIIYRKGIINSLTDREENWYPSNQRSSITKVLSFITIMPDLMLLLSYGKTIEF